MTQNLNLESWYFINRSTITNSFYEADDLLNTMPISVRSKKMEFTKTIGGTTYKFIPIPSLSYIIIVSTKLYAATAGTLTFNLLSTSAADIVMYVLRSSTGDLTTTTISGAANAVRTTSVNLLESNQYTIMFVQTNATMDSTLFIQSAYNGIRVPRNQAYVGGSGTVLQLSSSTVATVGDYKMSARMADFDGWLICDGRQVYRDAYPALFAIIGVEFGAGNGTTTFNLPDGRGRVSGAIGHGSNLSIRSIGNKAGAETHVLLTSEIPGHTHTGTTNIEGNHSHTINDPGHTHTQTTINDDFNSSGANPPGFTADSAGTRTWNNISSSTTGITLNINGSHHHTFTTSSIGGGASHNNMQPTLFVGNLFICAEI